MDKISEDLINKIPVVLYWTRESCQGAVDSVLRAARALNDQAPSPKYLKILGMPPTTVSGELAFSRLSDPKTGLLRYYRELSTIYNDALEAGTPQKVLEAKRIASRAHEWVDYTWTYANLVAYKIHQDSNPGVWRWMPVFGRVFWRRLFTTLDWPL